MKLSQRQKQENEVIELPWIDWSNTYGGPQGSWIHHVNPIDRPTTRSDPTSPARASGYLQAQKDKEVESAKQERLIDSDKKLDKDRSNKRERKNSFLKRSPKSKQV